MSKVTNSQSVFERARVRCPDCGSGPIFVMRDTRCAARVDAGACSTVLVMVHELSGELLVNRTVEWTHVNTYTFSDTLSEGGELGDAGEWHEPASARFDGADRRKWAECLACGQMFEVLADGRIQKSDPNAEGRRFFEQARRRSQTLDYAHTSIGASGFSVAVAPSPLALRARTLGARQCRS